jgi:cell division protein FtsB
MIGPSEPCEMFQEQIATISQQIAEIERLRAREKVLVEALGRIRENTSDDCAANAARAALASVQGESTPQADTDMGG